MPLTPKQQRFVHEYLVDLNATQAAIRAGYSEKTANKNAARLMVNEGVKAAIAESQGQRSVRTLITQDYVLKNLTEIVERCMQRAPVLNSIGEQLTEDGKSVWRFESKGAVAALKLLGEHLGMYTQRVEVESTTSLTIIEEVVRAVPPEEDTVI